jgi:response regulator RpfG family c-di-GMP phosphodiesterase
MDDKVTILLVDDDIDYLFQMEMNLKNMGYQVITCESRKEGEKMLQKMRPDLAIFDLMMETEDSGFILSYKAKQKYPDLPVIIATAVASETGISFGLNSPEEKEWIKADLYLEKGIRKEQLQKEIEKLLNR